MRAIAAYAYSAAGPGESTTDLAWDGHAAIFECGDRLAETARFPQESALVSADVDLGRIRQERMRFNTFGDCAREDGAAGRFLPLRSRCGSMRQANRFRCSAQSNAFPLFRPIPRGCGRTATKPTTSRFRASPSGSQATGIERSVIGVSGGLDSTQALIVAARAMDDLGLPRANVLAYTLPGFATSEQTKANAWALMRALGVTGSEIDIRPAARQMLADLGASLCERRRPSTT